MAEEQGVTSDQQAWEDRARGCHQMLLRLAGKAPDDLLTLSRDWLAHGDLDYLAQSVTFWAVSQDATLQGDDVILLSQLLTDADADPDVLTQVRIEDSDPFPYYGFAPEIPPELGGGIEEAPGPGAMTEMSEQAAMTAVAAEPGAVGMWRAWRFPSDGAPWPSPKRVFVVEVGAVIDESAVAARLQQGRAAGGEASPQVEVYQTGDQLPAYQEFARSYGELLWARVEDAEINVAAIFDEVDSETGPHFDTDHPRLAKDEADKVAKYLYSGEPLLVTTERMDDVVDPALTYSVPMSFRTDGTWIWTEAAAYYVERHLLEPDAGLLAHLRSNDYTVPAVDGVAVYRALQILQEPVDDESPWIYDSVSGAVELGPDFELESELPLKVTSAGEAEPVPEPVPQPMPEPALESALEEGADSESADT
jgi:hypothetical protein